MVFLGGKHPEGTTAGVHIWCGNPGGSCLLPGGARGWGVPPGLGERHRGAGGWRDNRRAQRGTGPLPLPTPAARPRRCGTGSAAMSCPAQAPGCSRHGWRTPCAEAGGDSGSNAKPSGGRKRGAVLALNCRTTETLGGQEGTARGRVLLPAAAADRDPIRSLHPGIGTAGSGGEERAGLGPLG